MDTDRIEGNLKQAEGKLTGDEDRAEEGRSQETWGKTKDKAGDVWDETKDKAEDAKDKLT